MSHSIMIWWRFLQPLHKNDNLKIKHRQRKLFQSCMCFFYSTFSMERSRSFVLEFVVKVLVVGAQRKRRLDGVFAISARNRGTDCWRRFYRVLLPHNLMREFKRRQIFHLNCLGNQSHGSDCLIVCEMNARRNAMIWRLTTAVIRRRRIRTVLVLNSHHCVGCDFLLLNAFAELHLTLLSGGSVLKLRWSRVRRWWRRRGGWCWICDIFSMNFHDKI